MVSFTFTIRRADNPEIPTCIQPDKNIGDRLRPAKCAHSDFPVTCAIAGRLGAQSDGLGILAAVPG